MAKPLLNFFLPELTGFVQPLAGEFAARRELLLRTPFLTGYGVEIAILADILNDVGLSAMAQVDLGSRQNRHQPLWDLTRMSSIVLRALARRVPVLPSVRELPDQKFYLHAVATEHGLRLDEHISDLLARPQMAELLASRPASRQAVDGSPVPWGEPRRISVAHDGLGVLRPVRAFPGGHHHSPARGSAPDAQPPRERSVPAHRPGLFQPADR
jgi:hypothetical protein